MADRLTSDQLEKLCEAINTLGEVIPAILETAIQSARNEAMLLEALKAVKVHLATAECQICSDDDPIISDHIRQSLQIARDAIAKADGRPE